MGFSKLSKKRKEKREGEENEEVGIYASMGFDYRVPDLIGFDVK
jgi:hypothetical protein